jgi:hypothetical protein
MWTGYIRRKATRILSNNSRGSHGKSNFYGEPQIHSPPPNLYQVVDKEIASWVDREYVEIGVREGWLKLDGWFFYAYQGREHMVYVYIHTG